MHVTNRNRGEPTEPDQILHAGPPWAGGGFKLLFSRVIDWLIDYIDFIDFSLFLPSTDEGVPTRVPQYAENAYTQHTHTTALAEGIDLLILSTFPTFAPELGRTCLLRSHNVLRKNMTTFLHIIIDQLVLLG
ncbi:hypothetical protein Y032_0333g2806 [Ancylostoma ceylanicum]|uniref:Uncharacterized protein n=1 Tax=Ancylostoma ceylanicum TaxID=53326 RepID=A0A016RYZ7_9BILA|nr:hypothetical protein Y032_0333g2806 [Ancylostoma ceylanicum]